MRTFGRRLTLACSLLFRRTSISGCGGACGMPRGAVAPDEALERWAAMAGLAVRRAVSGPVQ